MNRRVVAARGWLGSRRSSELVATPRKVLMKRPRRKSSPSVPQLVQRSPVREGRPFPLGATWDGLGVNFALFSANATKVELCLFDIDGKQELERHRTAGIHRRGLARLSAGGAARHGLRLSRAWTLRAGCRPSLQSQQAADRSLREAACRLADLGAGTVRLHARFARQGHVLRRARQRALDAEMPRHRPGLHLGSGPQAGRRRGSGPSSTRCMSRASPS